MEHFGKRLRYALTVCGYQKQIAFAAKMGVDESTVSRWLRGANITPQKLVRICDELNISIDWLLTGRGPYESRRPTVADDLQVRLRNASEGIPKPILLAVCELVETVQRQPSRMDEPQRP